MQKFNETSLRGSLMRVRGAFGVADSGTPGKNETSRKSHRLATCSSVVIRVNVEKFFRSAQSILRSSCGKITCRNISEA